MPVSKVFRPHWGWSFSALILMLAFVSVTSGQAPTSQASSSARQEPRATFKTGITHVEIPAIVVDRQGRFVTGLDESAFQLYDEGERQPISTFRLIDFGVNQRPADMAAGPAARFEADVHTNVPTFDGRLYVLVLDDFHIHPANTAPTRQLARQFVETQIGPNDLAAVVYTSGRQDVSQDITSDRRRLLASIDRFIGRRFERNDTVLAEMLFRSKNSLATIGDICNQLGTITGRRKALVLFSEGVEACGVGRTEFARGSPDSSQPELSDTISAAIRANVNIYGVDPGGLKAILETGDEERLEWLRRISLDTDGLVANNTNDFVSAFDRIGQDNSRYYLLGYSAPPGSSKGGYRRVKVKVNLPDVEVRTREGYFAVRGDTAPKRSARLSKEEASLPPVLLDALNHPLPGSGLRLAAVAVPFRASSGQASVDVVVQVDGRDIQFRQVDGRFQASFILAIAAIDPNGDTKALMTRTYTLPLRQQSYADVTGSGIRLVEPVDLPFGRYRMRIATQDGNSERVGSVHFDTDIPEFTKLPLSMSGVMLTSSLAATMPSAPTDRLKALRAFLPGPPSLSRSFRNSEVLDAFTEIYLRDKALTDVTVAATINTIDGRELLRTEARRAGAQMSGSNGVYPYTATIPLGKLAPGRYVLAVAAESGAKGKLSARREVPFGIVNSEIPPPKTAGTIGPRH